LIITPSLSWWFLMKTKQKKKKKRKKKHQNSIQLRIQYPLIRSGLLCASACVQSFTVTIVPLLCWGNEFRDNYHENDRKWNNPELTYNVYGIQCHMPDSVTYPILRCMLCYTNDQQLHHKFHLMTLGVQVCLLISWHE
jgi:hypothetical protein